jgi:hypothetical protein
VIARLKDGRVVRGKLVEWVPRKRLVLRLATGELRTLPTSEILEPDRIQILPCSPPNYPPIESEGAPLVVLHGAGKSVIERRFNAFSWGDVCVEPCYRRLDPRFLYRVSDHGGGHPTESFLLPATGSRTDVEASFRPTTLNTMGGIFAVGGLYLLVAGGTSFGLGKAIGADHASGRFLVTSGTVEMLLGGAFGLIGLPTYLVTLPTSSVRTSSVDPP